MSPLQIVLEVIHLIRNTLCYIFLTCVSLGRIAFDVLVFLYTTVVDIITFVAIVADELHLWIYELWSSFSNAAYDVKQSSNNCFNTIVDAICGILSHITSLLTNTRLRTRLLTTYIGQRIASLFKLLHDAIVLIADSVCWLVMFLPRMLFTILIAIGDGIVFIVYGSSKMMLNVIHTLIDDVFRLTVGLLVLFLVIRFRKLLINVLRRCLLKTFSCFGRIKHFVQSYLELQFIDRRPDNPIDRFTSGLPNKIDFSHSCVICRERVKTILLMPCRHLCFCQECSEQISSFELSCPLCRNTIQSMLNIYI